MNQFTPARRKFNTNFRPQTNYQPKTDTTLKHGNYGLMAMDACLISAQQLEAVRKVLTRNFKKIGTFYFMIHPQVNITKKSLGVRMGSGKGSVDRWVTTVRKGQMLVEIRVLDNEKMDKLCKDVLTSCGKKLPCSIKIIQYNPFQK